MVTPLLKPRPLSCPVTDSVYFVLFVQVQCSCSCRTPRGSTQAVSSGAVVTPPPRPVRACLARRARRLPLGLQHHADQSVAHRRPGGRKAGRASAPRLHRLLLQQGQPSREPLGELCGENELQRSLRHMRYAGSNSCCLIYKEFTASSGPIRLKRGQY